MHSGDLMRIRHGLAGPLAAAALLLAPFGTAPARAGAAPPDGGCTLAGDTITAEVTFVDEDDPSVTHTGQVVCSIQYGWDDLHSGTDDIRVTSPVGTGAAVIPPTAVTIDPPDGVYAFCVEVVVDGTTLYLNEQRGIEPSWWTTPDAHCWRNVQTLEGREDDFPGPYVDVAIDVTDGAACPVLAAADRPDVSDEWWVCDEDGWVAIDRTPAGAVLRAVPPGWPCTDAHTGLAVAAGAALALPDPEVRCTPPGIPQHCYRVNAAGALVPAGLGKVVVTSACGALSAARRLAVVSGGPVGTWNTVYGYYVTGSLPWRCAVDEALVSPAEPAYTAFCGAGFR
jgi:hypothetical protein